VDDFSKKSWVYLLRHKSEVLDNFKVWIKMAERQCGKKVKTIRSDNGGEYVSKEFRDYTENLGIVHQVTAPYTPQQNGVAERLNRTLMEAVRCMMHGAKVPERLWAEAVLTANYVRNRVPARGLQEKVPEEVYTGSKPTVEHLRIFGCKVSAWVPPEKRNKLEARGQLGILVGYSGRNYRVWNSNTRKVTVSRDMIFIEEPIVRSNRLDNVEEVTR
jgi:transposase InsO family protein